MEGTYLSRSAKITALLLCTVLLACLLTGCTVPVTERNLIAAALGPTAASFFTNSAQVQTDTAGAALPCYYDTASGTSYYVCEDLNKVSATEYGYTLRAFYFQNGVLRNRTLATRTVLYNASGQTFTSCRDYAGNAITDADYENYADRYFSSCSKVSFSLDSGTAAANQPLVVTPTPAPIPTPAPTPTPEPASYYGPAPVITKNPTSESLAIGGTTWFISHAQNANRLTWQAVSPAGLVYTTAEALSLHPGLVLENQANDTLAVRNVPASLNGWGFQARFEGTGGVAVSSAAYIYVGDYVGAYQSVLSAYRAAYQVGGHTAQYAVNSGLSPMIAHSSHVGYAFKDLDKDGTPELFIAGLNTDDAARSVMYDVYTLSGGVPARIAVSSDQEKFYLCTDNALFCEGSRGAGLAHAFIYRFSNNSLRAVEGYMSTFTGSSRDGYYYQSGSYSPEPRDGDVPVSQSTFSSRVYERENTVFQLLLTQIA